MGECVGMKRELGDSVGGWYGLYSVYVGRVMGMCLLG